jgi:hypothetical protein
LLLACGAPAALAQPQDPPPQDPAQYEAWRIRNYENFVGHPKPMPVIPPELRDIVSASRGTIAIQGLHGEELVLDITELEPTDFTAFANRRYIGFGFTSGEYYGYRVVDRTEHGIYPYVDTGTAPLFSPDNQYFVGVEGHNSQYGFLNGIGVWQVLEDGTGNRFFTDALPEGIDWRIDRWLDDDCVQFSAIDRNWRRPGNMSEAEALRQAPRLQYDLRVREVVTLTTGPYGCTDMGEAP